MCILCLVLQVFAEKKGLSIFKDKVWRTQGASMKPRQGRGTVRLAGWVMARMCSPSSPQSCYQAACTSHAACASRTWQTYAQTCVGGCRCYCCTLVMDGLLLLMADHDYAPTNWRVSTTLC
jgi:hypothetical protein